MVNAKALITRDGVAGHRVEPDEDVLPFDELRRLVLNGRILRMIGRYRESRLAAYRLDVMPKPLLSALLVRMLSRGPCWLTDQTGRREPVGLKSLWHMAGRLVRDRCSAPSLLRRTDSQVQQLTQRLAGRKQPVLNLAARPFYLRTDLVFGLRSGGSVGHIAGVLNHLDAFCPPPIFVTTDMIPTVRPDIEAHVILPGRDYWDLQGLPGLHFNDVFLPAARAKTAGVRPSFIYQRYNLNNYSGLSLAMELGVPFVLEYNGSETWACRNWGKPLKHEAIARRIEMLNLHAADVIVVVSQALCDELVRLGVAADKILVNPNGVDPQAYSPAIDGSEARSRLGLKNKTVVGFIGTFGPWHGAEVLAEAFGELIGRRPDLRPSIRLLMIGDGVTMPQVRRILSQCGVEDLAVLTGVVPQQQGPSHLAACDILISPHVPNSDGSEFFGSPTKLFEYMAMGKGIVASDLAQIGQVLSHGKTAWMVRPGDAESLRAGIEALIDDPPLRARLGQAAREDAVARHSWREHTRRILEKIKERCQ